ncbi:hypothetical protein Emed_003912 [Eimeria media]
MWGGFFAASKQMSNNEATIPVDCVRSQRKVRSKFFEALWLLSVYFFGTFLMFSLCHPAAKNITEEGGQRRRLSEYSGLDDDDLTPPSTPELMELCIGFEDQLSNIESSSEYLRASPLLVEEYFNALEKEAGQVSEVMPTDSFRSVDKPTDLFRSVVEPTDLFRSVVEDSQIDPQSFKKRPAPADTEGDEEVVGPAQKVARMDLSTPTTSVATEEPSVFHAVWVQAGDSDASESSRSSDSSDLADFVNTFVATLEPRESSSVSPSTSADASLSSAAAGARSSSASSGDQDFNHPWLRIPSLEAGVKPRVYRPDRVTSVAANMRFTLILHRMRGLLVKPELNQIEANTLVAHSELLVKHAIYKMNDPVSTHPLHAVDSLGRRFMMFYTLHLASRTLRQDWTRQPWWFELVSAVRTGPPIAPEEPRRMTLSTRNALSLSKRLSAAIDLLKIGSSPGKREIVNIMRQLFCTPVSPLFFKTEMWDPWRTDDNYVLPQK